MEQIYDLIIIGGGPAGLSCAITAAGSDLSVLLITNGPSVGGKMLSLDIIDNYPGFPTISGPELSDVLKEHCDLNGVEFSFETVTKVELEAGLKTVYTETKDYSSVGLVLACGELDSENFLPGIEDLKYDKYIKSAENCKTSKSCVYAAGNARMKPYGTISSAISDGISAAYSYLDDIK